MSCTSIGPSAFICQPTLGGAIQRRIVKCWGICETETSRVVAVERSPYYGPTMHCLDCGDTWSGEGLFGRPFRPKWREEAKRRANSLWQQGCWCDVEYDDDHYALRCADHASGDPL